ncbi:hypothetical protein DFJ73DRAFT_865414 [Zopfochytrium polystomum]|nr:hypothetical protein DFJ73DRAFT_865414 [Zopfochytrium polystomum]
METDPYARLFQMLDLSHKVLRRGCRQIDRHAPTLTQADVPAFVGYCIAFVKNIEEHHKQEEELMFPVFAAKVGGVATRLEEHKLVAEALRTFSAHLHALDPSTLPSPPSSPPAALGYDPSTFLDAFSPIRDVVIPHMTSEDGDISPATLRAGGVSEAEVRGVIRAMAVAGRATDRTVGLAFMLVHMGTDERAVFFGNVPWFLRDYVFPSFTLWNGAYWKFASTED